jgi:hypothetical protein
LLKNGCDSNLFLRWCGLDRGFHKEWGFALEVLNAKRLTIE